MNPIYGEVLGAIFRWLIGMAAGWLEARHIITEGQAHTFTADFSQHLVVACLALTPIVWSIWRKVQNRIELQTALNSPPTTEAAVKQTIKDGNGAALLAALLAVTLTLPIVACAPKLPPAGVYNQSETRIYQTEDAEQAVIRLSQSAVALNATTGPTHLSDTDTAYVRDFALAFDQWRASYANGDSTLAQAQTAFDTLNSRLSVDAKSAALRAVLAVVADALSKLSGGN